MCPANFVRECEGHQILFFHNLEEFFWEKSCSVSALQIIGAQSVAFPELMSKGLDLMHQGWKNFEL